MVGLCDDRIAYRNSQTLRRRTREAMWNTGVTAHCFTDAVGRCTVQRSGISPGKTASLSITVVSGIYGPYSPAANHDPDGDSNGTTITVSKR